MVGDAGTRASSGAGPADALLAEGRRRYEAGDFADAEPLARRALELLPSGVESSARAVAVQLAGECAFSLGRYREARDLADEALTLRAAAPEADRAESLNLRGIVDLSLGEAEAGHERVAAGLAMREAALGPDDPDTIESLNNTGVALARIGRMAEALAAHEEALRRCEWAFWAPHRQLAVSCNALAVKLDREEATRERAGVLYERALAAAEAALGPEHPMVATLLSNVGTGRLNAGDLEAARPLLERARAAAVAADAALMAGQLDVAAVAAGEAIALVEGARGQMRLELVEPLHRAAAVERARGDPRRALALDRRAFDILAAAYGERHPFVLHALARLAIETGRAEGSAAGRRDLERLRGILADAEPGGLAAHLRDVVDRRLADIGGGTGRRRTN